MRRFLKYGYVSFSKERGAKDLGFRFVSSFNVTSKKYLLMHFKPLPAKLTYFEYNSYTKLILMKKFKKIILTGARDGGILCCAYGAAFGSVGAEYFCGGCFLWYV